MGSLSLERGRCRICGQLCDFAGQEYCRSCLRKFRDRDSEMQQYLRGQMRQAPHRGDDAESDSVPTQGVSGKSGFAAGIAFGLFWGIIAGMTIKHLLF